MYARFRSVAANIITLCKVRHHHKVTPAQSLALWCIKTTPQRKLYASYRSFINQSYCLTSLNVILSSGTRRKAPSRRLQSSA